jgi:hypothetical protein
LLWQAFFSLSITLLASAQTTAYQGIYAGKAEMYIVNRGDAFYPARLTVLPDGHSILLTMQLPNAVTSIAIKGSSFEGESRERLNARKVYNWGTKYTIEFVGDEARMHSTVINPPLEYVVHQKAHEGKVSVFHRISS